MEDINTKSVRYPVATDQKLEKLALKLGRPKKLVFIQMVEYFYRSKKDPTDLGDELLKKELINGNSRIISFFRRQESDFLLPIFSTSETLTVMIQQHTLYLKAISVFLDEKAKKTDQLSLQLAVIDKGVTKIQSHMQEKALLKSRFTQILDYYINHRESLGWTAANIKKEELQVQVRQSLENL